MRSMLATLVCHDFCHLSKEGCYLGSLLSSIVSTASGVLAQEINGDS